MVCKIQLDELKANIHSQIYLRRQQERGLVHKARRLMDKNSVSFQIFPILLSSITLGSESQIPVCSRTVRAILRSLFCFVSLYGGSLRRSQNLEIIVFSVKEKTSKGSWPGSISRVFH